MSCFAAVLGAVPAVKVLGTGASRARPRVIRNFRKVRVLQHVQHSRCMRAIAVHGSRLRKSESFGVGKFRRRIVTLALDNRVRP
jgi:hypothetical protein